ncbi:MAG: DEAD/DEAH box helicase family protein [Patescibacteria group bacterium]|nr:DEAD/DEAH box helicase family protein [Patescibacteria group bacterium]
MSKLILQNIADDISFDSLPVFWQNFDLKSFSKEKTLYDFQEKALENALKILWLYYGDKFNYKEKENLQVNNERKKALFELYQDRLDRDFSYDLTKKEGKKTANLLKEGYYSEVDNKIGFENFINRMAFWMATGSGKTLVIVKLIELFKKLIENKEIPANDILFGNGYLSDTMI